MTIGTGIVTSGSLRPYSMTGVVSGVGATKANFTEIGLSAGISKDNARVSIERVIKEMSEKAKSVNKGVVL